MIEYNNKLIFRPIIPGNPITTVWESDGTIAGTFSFALPANVSFFQSFGVVNNKVVFVTQWCPPSCNPGVQDSTLVFAFSNSVSNTTIINRFKSKNNPGTIKAGVMPFANKLLFYKLSNVSAWNGGESYFVLSDGTVAGTTKIYVGDSYWANGNNVPNDLAIVNNKVFASVMTRPSFIDSNGNFTQTNDYVCSSYYTYKYANRGNKLYFAAGDASTNTELWETDGTVSNTFLNLDINPGNASSFNSSGQDSYFNPFVTTTNKLFFYATDGATGYELWVISDNPTSIKNSQASAATIFTQVIPNPANEICNIKLQGVFNDDAQLEITLYNYSGLIVSQLYNGKSMDIVNEKIIIDTKKYSSGLYFIKTNYKGNTNSTKFIIAH